MRRVVFFSVFLVSLLSGQSLYVIHLKSSPNPGKQAFSGQPLYPRSSNAKKERTDFFSRYRIFRKGETLPAANQIISIDTVTFLSVENQVNHPSVTNKVIVPAADSAGKNVRIGIIDTGIDFNHPQISPFLYVNSAEDINKNGKLDAEDLNGIDEDANGYIDDVSGYDFVDTPSNPDFGDYLNPDPIPEDEYPGGHGTAVAHQTVISSGYTASIVNLRAGSGSGFLREDIVAKALFYAFRNNIAIINMSFGDSQMSTFLIDLIEYLSGQGMLFIASAGNSKSIDLHFPSSLSTVLSVGSFSKNGFRSGFSNYGYFVDLYALGENVQLAAPGGGSHSFSGTSFSAPVVSGALSKIWASNPDLRSEELMTNALLICQDKGAVGWDFENANGLFIAADNDYIPQHSRFFFNRPFSQHEYKDSLFVTITCAGFGTGFRGLYLAGMQDSNGTFSLLKNISTASDSFWVKTENPGSYVLKLSWVDQANQRNIELHQQVRMTSAVPKIKTWELVPTLEGINRAYLLKAILDHPGKIRFNSDQTTIESGASDSISYIQLMQGFNSVYTGNNLTAFNRIGESAPEPLPEIEFSTLLTGSFSENARPLLNGNGYIWPRFIQNLFAVTIIDENNGFSNLQLYDRNNGSVSFSFDQPWIIRDLQWLNSDTVRMMMGFGDNSRLVDFSLQQNAIVNQWPFDGFWAVKFIGNDVLMRANSNFYLYRKLSDLWEQIFVFDQHNQQAQFSVPAASIVNDFLAFADVSGIVYVYQKISEGQYQYLYQVKLRGIDPANLITNWSINLNGEMKNSLWCLSKIVPENITEANSSTKYWSLEGFNLGRDKADKITDINFNGVAPQGKKWPAMGVVRVADEDYLALHVYPESYFFSFSDSLILAHAKTGSPSWYNYELSSADGIFLANRDDGSIVEVNLVRDIILPKVTNIQWQIPDSTQILLRWDGLKNAQYLIREVNSGASINSNTAIASFPISGIPSNSEISIQQQISGNNSLWSEPVLISITGFPVLTAADYFSNAFIELQFDQDIKIGEGHTLFLADSGRISSANQIAPDKILLKYSLPERESLSLQISNLVSEQNALFHSAGIFIQQSKQSWQPEVNVTPLSQHAFLLNFVGQFEQLDLTNIDHYSIYPQGEVLGLTWQKLNEIELDIADLGANGYDYQIQVSNIEDVFGRQLKQTSFFLPQPKVENLKDISIYPQPLIYSKQKQLTIAGLTGDIEVDVFSATGRYICRIKGPPSTQKLIWDLKNKSGEIVGSGVYLLIIRNQSEKQIKKVLIIR